MRRMLSAFWSFRGRRMDTRMPFCVIALALFLSGCCNGDVLCVGALTIHFSRTVTFPYHAEARSLRDSVLASADCAQAESPCGVTSVSFLGVQDEQVVMRISEGTLVSVDTGVPTYERPRACADCLGGVATMRLAQP